MQQEYIIPPIAIEKLRRARAMKQPVLIYGATGFGKTELVRQYFSNRKYLYLSGTDETWDTLPILEKGIESSKAGQQLIVVIDDLHMVVNEERRTMVRNLLEHPEIWIILINRSRYIRWLSEGLWKRDFVIIAEHDLCLSRHEIEQLLKQRELSLEETDIDWICNECEGHYPVISKAIEELSKNCKAGEALKQRLATSFGEYLECHVIPYWSQEILDFLMSVSIVDCFDKVLAEQLTQDAYVAQTIEHIQNLGNFLAEENGTYKIRFPLLQILRNRSERYLGKHHMEHLMHIAASYYEKQEQLLTALNLYVKANDSFYIRKLLMENARKNPGNGYFYEMRKYYFMFSEEECREDVWLMAAMAMIYSLSLQPEESERWYQMLVAYKERAKGSNRRAAMERITYLDITMPHRGSVHILDILKRGIALMRSESIQMSEFSVTSNLPSLMNGGKDFCEWSKRDQEIANVAGKTISLFLGRHGKGLVNTALAESGYEKGQELEDIMSRLATAKLEAEAGGSFEMEFVIIGLMIRCVMMNGDISYAKRLLNGFEQKMTRENQSRLLPNIHTVECRIALVEGDVATVDAWLQQAPDENDIFFCMERYRYLTKIRCYLWKEQYMEAKMLIEKMQYYVKYYDRPYIAMELGILTAILHYRQRTAWQTAFLKVLETIASYHFVRILSEEGAAVYPLLEELSNTYSTHKLIQSDWFQQVIRETRRTALHYPLYVKHEVKSVPKISEIALQILRLQADGFSYTQISERLDMKIATVKYHVMATYRKLGVSSKTDAVLAAKSMNLI